MKTKLLLILSILALSFPSKVLADTEDAVVQIYSGFNAVGVGFLWKDQRHVVTALHVVAGRKKIKVRSFKNGSTYKQTATVEKVLKKADLALLKLSEPIDASPTANCNI